MIANHRPAPQTRLRRLDDLLQPSADEIARVSAATGLRVPTEGQVSDIESSSRLAFDGGAFYLSAPLVAVDADGEHALTPVGFVLSSRVLLTVRLRPPGRVRCRRERVGRAATAERRRGAAPHLRDRSSIARPTRWNSCAGAACDDLVERRVSRRHGATRAEGDRRDQRPS